ncbi:TIGR02302 family protein [Sulfitobacter aestuariivivens]|uniref:TIGR02302 family protein n=1 Tax=Sulfitobacter aestuariivivens TaxID=2766981 RepID=A0A927HG96_9RHOB|nr:TIGR02302 family protein [Sulfitobacter aestuariivivens]MBD3664030.1 TIGR02302 family protein [Sulfitobacter aestuariivivens]
MASFTPNDLRRTMTGLRWPVRLTWGGMLAEQVVQAFWPLMTVCLIVLAALMLGVQDSVLVEVVWVAMVVTGLAGLGALYYAARHFRVPTRDAAMARLDESMPGRPIQALLDDQAIGDDDTASIAVWRAHKARMADRAAQAQAVPGDLRVSRRDPYALRFVAVLFFAVALIFGSIWRVGSVADMAPGGTALASGPVWEGWAEPPRYTGKPTLYLNDLAEGPLDLPKGTLITVRFYGEVGALTLEESVSGRPAQQVAEGEAAPQADPVQDFTVLETGQIAVQGPGGRVWDVTVLADTAPQVERLGDPEVSALGETRLPFAATDDYGVEAGEARITLDLASVDRRYGLALDPEPREDIVVPLPMPISGSRAEFQENLIENFSEHPWANLPVTISLSVLDAAEQQTMTDPSDLVLPGRRFFDPTAASVIEMRRDLLWARANAPRTAQVLRAVSNLPDDLFRSQTTALRLRDVIKRLEIHARYGVGDEVQQKLADDMWDLAIELEEGVLADALERMRRAQDRLNEAIKNGASKEEIAELMDELRRATEEYLNQLSRQQAQQNEQNGQPQGGESMQMTQDDLQRMMDRIQELMEQGRMAEAEEALRQLQEMMENMRVTQGQQGQGGNNPGQQSMDDLAETLREQQGLSDQAFRDLQEQFNPNAQAGENQGNEGRNGGEGRGQSHEGQNGQGDGNGEQQQPGQGNQQAERGEDGAGGMEQGLADRQQALRDELRRQQGRLPGQGTAEGDAARDALDRAGRAMDDAEEALRNRDLADAIDNQAQAMEALREGMRSLGEAMAQQERERQPGQGAQESDRRANTRDPLGREQGGQGAESTDAPLAMGPDASDRARELLDEIRRRSGEAARPEIERDYLNRLLERF